MTEKVDLTWFFCSVAFITLTWISLYLLFHYLLQNTAFLEDFYFVPDGHKKRQCFLRKRWLNSILLGIWKLNSLSLLMNKINMLQDVLKDLHLIRDKAETVISFLVSLLSKLSKLKSIHETFWLKMIHFC